MTLSVMVKKKVGRQQPKRRPTPPPQLSGGLEYALGQIDSQLAMMQQVLSEDRMSSAQYRTEVRKQLGEQSDKMTKLEGQVEHIGTDVTDIKNNMTAMDLRIEALEAVRHQSTGASRAWDVIRKGAYGIAGGLGGLAVYLLEHVFKFGSSPPPPGH